MATDAFHRKVSQEIFEKMVSAQMVSFDEHHFYKILYPLLKRENAFSGRTYHGRKIKPIVEKMFKKLQEERLKELENFVLT